MFPFGMTLLFRWKKRNKLNEQKCYQHLRAKTFFEITVEQHYPDVCCNLFLRFNIIVINLLLYTGTGKRRNLVFSYDVSSWIHANFVKWWMLCLSWKSPPQCSSMAPNLLFLKRSKNSQSKESQGTESSSIWEDAPWFIVQSFLA